MLIEKSYRSFLSTLCLTPLFWGAFNTPVEAAAPAPRIAIVESLDKYTHLLGLAEFLAAEELAFTDLSAAFERGETPDLSQVDLLIVGSFVTTEPRMRDTYLAAGETFRRFVADGGVVAVLCQADQDHPRETWMEAPRQIVRVDPNANRAYMTRKNHPLLNRPEELHILELTGWRVPESWHVANTVWEQFSQWSEAGVVLGVDSMPSPAGAGLLEMGWGDGRAVFYAMAPDKAFAGGNDVARTGGTKLLRNLVAYAASVRDGKANPVEIIDSPGYKHEIQGVVYLDENGNGQRDEGEPGLGGIVVSDGYDIVTTDRSGEYRLLNRGRDAAFVFVHQPGVFKQSGQEFYRILPYGGTAGDRFDFGLRPANESEDESPAPSGNSPDSVVRFVQLSDSHVRNVSDRDYMRQATAEIYAMEPPPDFVVATGDLVDWGVDEHFQNYVEGMDGPPIPYFNVFGNHEIVFGPIERYREYIGPDYYSFERAGILFVAVNCVTPNARQDTWLERTLEQLGEGRPVVLFQHFPPSPEALERFAGMGIKSVFSGHWHSEKEMEHANVQSFNTPPFFMGGIDASPGGFKLVHMTADGRAETEWRYGFQNKRLTIVSPGGGSPVNDSRFPILVNAYDTSHDVASVKWRLESANRTGGDSAGSGNLRRESALSWIGEHNHGNSPAGSYAFHVEALDERGETWTASQQIETMPGEPAAPAPGREWPMFMGDAAHTGFTPETVDASSLRLAWSVDTGGDLDFSSPILADGRLYLALKKRTLRRTNGVAAFDPVTGDRLWLFETPMAINHTPAFAEGILCVAEMGGRVYGVDAATGEQRWHHDIIDNRGRYSYCAPAAHDGWFYAGVTRRLAKLRPANGQVDWEEQIGAADNDWISSYGSPAVSGNALVMTGNFGRGDTVIVARADDGSRKIWGHPSDSGMLASATIAGDRVLFCSLKSILYCKRLSDGQALWSQGLGADDGNANWSATTPAVKLTGEGQGIVVAGSGDGRMSGIDLAGGEILWTHVSDPTVFKVSPYRRDDRPLLSSPTIAGDKVFFGSADGRIYCLDLATGEKLWSYLIGASVMSTPLVTGNAVYIAAYDGRLYAFTSK